MHRFWIRQLSLVALLLAVSKANPTAGSDGRSTDDGVVEIIKQKLIKFPDDIDQPLQLQQQQNSSSDLAKKQKTDEAKRILEEIEKINESFGYKKKQQSSSPMQPKFDSNHFLFPKPAQQPFHEQSHQISGANGELLLVPSIRAVKLDRSFNRNQQHHAEQLASYNAPPQHGRAQIAVSSNNINEDRNDQYYFRPHRVHVPAVNPTPGTKVEQLPAHFAIPVRLYKLNKEDYIKQFKPHEYRIKGYKIVGDIEDFYGKAKNPIKHHNKSTHKAAGAKKSTAKYHLFFLPRELVFNEDSTLKQPPPTVQQPLQQSQHSSTVSVPSNSEQDNNSREEKFANRPLKVQASANTASTGNSTNLSSSTQVVRKRLIPKPLRNKQTNVNSLATQQLSDGSSATASTTIHITPSSSSSAAALPGNANINSGIINVPTNSNPNQNNFNVLSNRPAFGFLGLNNFRPAFDSVNGNTNNFNKTTNNNTTGASNAIKMAFQNIFKFPFRPDPARPDSAISSTADIPHPLNLEAVPLQTPQKTFFGAQSLFPQALFYGSDAAAVVPSADQLPHRIDSAQPDKDYKWDDESNNSAAAYDDDHDNNSSSGEEKHIFGIRHHLQQQQDTQKEALRQGGIIIQRLKVRKGGIAIAGPGGVATAGSGGTAIVGPGGYALTHPRSLTIAGPGAKVIAIPADVDLKDALQRTNLNSQSFPREGKIVATGPTVYYAPPTTSMEDTGRLH